MNVVDKIVDRLSVFNSLYDMIRIVDPVSKVVKNCKDGSVEDYRCSCYEYWQRADYCNNCISMRAFVQNETCVKLESKEGKVYLIIACPIEFNDQIYIVELLKDISHSTMIDMEYESSSIDRIINEVNDRTVTDQMTGVYNSKYLIERLSSDVANHSSNKPPISIIALDIDLFDRINQLYGYRSGDIILKKLAQIMTNDTKDKYNWIARCGGDEFVIVIYGNKSIEGSAYAEKLRQDIENTIFEVNDHHVKLTASMIVYELSDGMDIAQLLQQIKDSMYEVKNLGRNRVIVKNLCNI